jgi:hypothetical protein
MHASLGIARAVVVVRMKKWLGIGAFTVVLAAACGAPDEGGTPLAAGPQSGGDGVFGKDAPATSEDDVGACTVTTASVKKLPVDIIFVIDNSPSMHDEMSQVRANVNRFADKIGKAGLDYRVVFIVPKATSTKYEGICVPPPLGKSDCGDNPPRFFHVDQNVGSWESLSLILSTYEGTATAPGWKTRLRPEATKVFVEVSDDDSRMTASEFDRTLREKLPAGMFGTAAGGRNYVFHSIVSKPNGAKAPSTEMCATANGPSIEYQRLSLLSGGMIDEVCQTDYSALLDRIAGGVQEKVSCELSYPKTEKSDPSMVVVRYTASGATERALTQLTDASKCGKYEDGWYYDHPTDPQRIVLCPATCAAANAQAGSKIEAAVGCKAPPPR